jgi:hypothetical protein
VAGIVAWVVIWATWLPSITSANEPPFLAEGRAHWAFQPLKPVSSHQSGQGNQSGKANASDRPLITGSPIADYFSNNPIDAFVFARLAQQGLSPAPPADPRTLARRLYFDLIGLPPTPEEVEAFVRQFSPSDLPTFPPARGESGKVSKRESEQVAVAALVDKLLASPHYGERWGRHWLDVARFAETDGFEHDLTRPHAWRYRDYVIRAFNADKPYDRFIREQIAGDELFPDDPDALIATAFNLLGPDMVDSSDQVQRRLNTLNDMTDTAAAAFLGLTLGCARCHDHKFEPFSQRDYFRLQAYFTPATFRSDLPVPSREQRDAY